MFPADDESLAIDYFSYESIAHYEAKRSRYTEAEAENRHRRGERFDWREGAEAWARALRDYYDRGRGAQDGPHGLIWALAGAGYAWDTHAKLFERCFRAGVLEQPEEVVPPCAEAFLLRALAVLRAETALSEPVEGWEGRSPVGAGPPSRPTPSPSVPSASSVSRTRAADVVWCGPVWSASGYGEECRTFLFALEDAGVAVAARDRPWGDPPVELGAESRLRLERLCARPAGPGFVQVVHDLPPRFVRDPEASAVIARTMFETDRLPRECVVACNRMDRVWVPSEFNRETFALAGVAREKLAVIPGCLDPGDGVMTAASSDPGERPYRFLSVFDWTLHKGWDVLLRGFLEAFPGREDVELVLKVWSSLGYGPDGIREQAGRFAREELGHDLPADQRIRFITDRLSRRDSIMM
jgi:glycosyltransferase involved in cell wall biosynthesis